MVIKNKKTEKNKAIPGSDFPLTISSNENSHSYSFLPNSQTIKKFHTKNTPQAVTYEYVKQDMQRTITITLILLGLSTLLFVFIQLKIIQLSFLGY